MTKNHAINSMLTAFFTAALFLPGCTDSPAPSQYDRVMLSEYFDKSPAEVEKTFGKPSSIERADSKAPPKNANAEAEEKFAESTESMTHTYSTVDGDLVFHFNQNEKVCGVTYAGNTVSPPKQTSKPAESSASKSNASAILVDMDGIRHRLPQAEADFLAGLIAAQPDVDTTDHIKLDPPYRVIVDEVDLDLMSDEVILMHRDGTKKWTSKGVRNRILSAAEVE